MEDSLPVPKTLYGANKLLVENYLNLLHIDYPNFVSIVFRVSNVYGAKVSKNRINGLVDKFLTAENNVNIFCDIENTINLIHIKDIIDLLFKAMNKKMDFGHYLFLVGNETYKISEIIKLILKVKDVKITINETENKCSYINLDCSKVKNYFNWTCNHNLNDTIKYHTLNEVN